MYLRLLEVPLMRRFFENRIAFAATVLAFATALAVNALYGNDMALSAPSSLPTVIVSVNVLPAASVQALPGLPPFECDGCPPPAASLMASAQALPGLPPFECDGCPPPAESLMASAQALPGLPPFECDGCPPPAQQISTIADARDSHPQFFVDLFSATLQNIDPATARRV